MKLNTVLGVLQLLPLPIISSLYLAFCWIVQGRIIPVPTSRFIDTSTENFRIWKTIPILLRWSCSFWFLVAFISGFVVIATSSLAPATLTVHEVFLKSNDTTFDVGAILASPWDLRSDFNDSPTYQAYSPNEGVRRTLQHAASIVWAEAALGVNYSFSPAEPSSESSDRPQYLIPLPTDLFYNMSATWVTDVFAMRPSCNWQSGNLTLSIDLDDDGKLELNGTLPELNIGFVSSYNSSLHGDSSPISYAMFSVSAYNGYFTSFNTTSDNVPEGGYSVWAFIQDELRTSGLSFNLTDVPTTPGDGGRFSIATLACYPNFSIETVKVQNEGRVITIQQHIADGRQGNLDQSEANRFFTALLDEPPNTATPSLLGLHGSGTQVQTGLIFGWDRVETIKLDYTLNLPPPFSFNGYHGVDSQAITNIPDISTFGFSRRSDDAEWSSFPIRDVTATYARYLQSAAKPYLTGALNTTQVPGIIYKPTLAFTASMTYAIISTILLLTLNILNIRAFFRSTKGEVFSLFTVADLLHDSNVAEGIRHFRENAKRNASEEDLLAKFEKTSGERFITLNKGTLCLGDTLNNQDDVDEKESLVPASPSVLYTRECVRCHDSFLGFNSLFVCSQLLYTLHYEFGSLWNGNG
ncbi:hypothetical protein AX16_011034 [Volvariella volvacea WC 439]|nr:hypothetical protein AX16_011034 [Volvariella volvacea WC 439]